MRTHFEGIRLYGRPTVRRGLRRGWAWLQNAARVQHRNRARLDGSCAAVLTYHRVLPVERARALCIEPGMFVTPETLRKHLGWLQAEGFVILPLGEVSRRLRQGARLPLRAVSISFDDGWLDFYEHAWPILTEHSAPATVFVVTERVGTLGAFWPDEVWRRLSPLSLQEQREVARDLQGSLSQDPRQGVLSHLKQLPRDERERSLEQLREQLPDLEAPARELLDWVEIEKLAREGIDFESHGRTHAILTSISQEELQQELTGSLRRLHDRDMGKYSLLAYPSGAVDRRVSEASRAAGYRAAFTTQRGLARGGENPLELPRIGLHEDICATHSEFFQRVPGAA